MNQEVSNVFSTCRCWQVVAIFFCSMRINASLKSIDIDGIHLTDELVCGALRDALANNSDLESVTLRV
jgi:hypothetical protein